MDISELLETTIEKGATDLHLTKNSPPVLRIHGELIPLDRSCLTGEDTDNLVMNLLSPKQKEVLKLEQSVDLAYSLNGTKISGRFRINAFYQRGSLACAIRRLSDKILSLEELGFPSSVCNLCQLRDGLILVTGVTGSGKTTTLASMVDRINNSRSCHIITIEDPVEYIHCHKKAIINQREIHTDVRDFASALRFALREDPDVILVGEMRDLETMRTAIMAAETGHLVLATLHTQDAVSTIRRVIGVFPEEEQEQIRHQLSMTLKAVVSQRLLRRKDGSGRVPAVEMMIVTSGIANLIRLHKDEQIYSAIETGAAQGMQTIEHSL
ncbi:MAG: PilT/PilU family type 4a pilus ATPase, partial [Candidatus Omnitrophica bacterium]|nr:PilT/PilU family type 4a pilus ATPase [Candidatus Omnitrophota bacterium]